MCKDAYVISKKRDIYRKSGIYPVFAVQNLLNNSIYIKYRSYFTCLLIRSMIVEMESICPLSDMALMYLSLFA